MGTTIIVFSVHLKIDSLAHILPKENLGDKIVLFTSHYIYTNEREVICHFFNDVEFVCFADVMNDSDGAFIDTNCFNRYKDKNRLSLRDSASYYDDIQRAKNELLVKRIEEKYQPTTKLVASSDLGVYLSVWLENGYKYIEGEYYYQQPQKKNRLNRYLRKDFFSIACQKLYISYPKYLSVAHYEDKKILFHGHLNRAAYRMDLIFKEDKAETFKFWVIKVIYAIFRIKIERRNVINLTTIHEYGNNAFHDMIDIPEFHNYIFQDGYLPPNDTCKYLFFYGKYSKFLTWDKLGCLLFQYHNIPARILPCRKVYLLPEPLFSPIKKVVVVTSGAGDWTALKNRSDEEKTAEAFVTIARRYPKIEFVYRCHPIWGAPGSQGINSIPRLVKYFKDTQLPNIRVSSNIPSAFDEKGQLVVSHSRSSLEEDLKDANLVFGVHSISMIDAALKNIPFASVNLSGRRNLWKGISDIGFPHCEDIESIAAILQSTMDKEFQNKYLLAVENYNRIIIEK